MKEISLSTKLKAYDTAEELPETYRELLEKARNALKESYAPYSHFQVGAAILMEDGNTALGANQENAAYPMCLCAERVALSNAVMQFPGRAIRAIAITVFNPAKAITEPAAPCGSCRQAICETEARQNAPITLILQGAEGPVYVADSGKAILPLSFHGGYL
ncbi:MAG: cytidine deaminase [Phaeodactylibacter sp.]|nr:cytidine deaminase [Phaeodactylibacter sp.]MCB9274170.1 cytidine deaminase [Lewinellaceae bacterium]